MNTWSKYRSWKHFLIPLLVGVAWLCLHEEPDVSPLKWKAGVVIGVCLAVAYIAEEIFWMTQRQGRPCGHCGTKIQMKSFQVHADCPHCGSPLE